MLLPYTSRNSNPNILVSVLLISLYLCLGFSDSPHVILDVINIPQGIIYSGEKKSKKTPTNLGTETSRLGDNFPLFLFSLQLHPLQNSGALCEQCVNLEDMHSTFLLSADCLIMEELKQMSGFMFHCLRN